MQFSVFGKPVLLFDSSLQIIMNTLKQLYFTPATIDAVSRQMLDALDPYTRRHSFTSALDHSALLVLDMQSYFLDPASHAFIPSAPAILAGINALIDAYTRHGLPVFLSRHLNTTQDAGMMASWWRDLISTENPLSNFDPQLEWQKGIAFTKTRYDAFLDSPLEAYLRTNNVEQVVICGVMTHLCCETTARSAFMRGFEVLFTVDGTATYNEDLHRASLLNLSHGFAVPVLVQDLLSRLEQQHG